jgi:hypothetical protein
MTCSSGRSHRRSQSLLLLYHPSWPPLRSRCVSPRPKTVVDLITSIDMDLNWCWSSS